MATVDAVYQLPLGRLVAHCVLFYIHHMNQATTHNGSAVDSTINIVFS